MLALFAGLDHRFGIEVHAYCLMGNHFHLLVRSPLGTLSDAMAWLGSRFTRLVNAERDVDGPVFRGRFHSVAVTRSSHLDRLFRYVNANHEIADAVRIARAPGPDVNTAAEVRAVHTVIAARSGLCVAETSTVAHLDRAAYRRDAAHAERRCVSSGPTRDLLERAVSVMQVGHRVSATE